MNRPLTEKIRTLILGSGMDLVGFAPVERWKDAPYLLSPPAILPEAATVVVAGIHITDTWAEMGGTPESQDRSPGGWMDQNSLMDRIAFKTVRTLNDAGHRAIAVVSSNIWRYRKFEGIPSLFAPDLSHIHAAAAAGLAEIGWSGLAITPEFGSRVRFISIVTDAGLVPTPMYDGPRLCDMCGECIRHCPSQALKKDFNDLKPHVVTIGGKTFRYANKNIWRCAWAEHFNLDLRSPALDREHIDETSILAELRSAGVRGHERGVCQKVCVPPHLRSKNPSFGRDWAITQNRVNRRYPDSMPTLRKMRDDICSRAIALGAELSAVGALDPASEAGKLALGDAPGMRSVFGFAFRTPAWLGTPECDDRGVYYMKMHHILLRTARMIEDYGYHAASYTCNNFGEWGKVERALGEQAGLGKMIDGRLVTPEYGADVVFGCITTDAPVDFSARLDFDRAEPEPRLTGEALRRHLESVARGQLMTAFGVAPAERIDRIADQLDGKIDLNALGERVADVCPLPYHGDFIPEIRRKERSRLSRPGDYLAGAKSVIVMGTHFQDEVIRNLAGEKNQQIGCYGFMQFQVIYENFFAAIEVGARLQAMGYEFRIVSDLLGLGSMTASARGEVPDMRSNALEAVAAGLGALGEHGALLTPEHGPHQRTVAIITDAELSADAVMAQEGLCRHCGECAKHCTMAAFGGEFVPVEVGGVAVDYPVIPRHRCDWAKRYSLNPAEGPGLIGNNTCVAVPGGEITIEAIAAGCAAKDPIMKSRTCVFEPCLKACPGKNKKIVGRREVM